MSDLFTPRIRAPEFAGIITWLNSSPMTMEGLKGKVVLIDFWTYTCVNCLRTLPYVKKWHEKYAKDGLVVIGVHTPEFEFEKSAQNVKKAADRFGLAYPIALDNEVKTWEAFANQCWPAKFLIDKEGYLVYAQFGEGQYAQTEEEIMSYLEIKKKTEKEEFPSYMFDQSPETYTGFEKNFGLGSGLACDKDGCNVYMDPGEHEINTVYPHGQWVQEADYIELKKAPGKLSIRFNAREVNVVMVPLGAPVKASVFIDDKKAGEVTVDSPRMYTVYKEKNYSQKDISLIFDGNVRVYAFTFG
jgi:thiol-disulfide isomerase/thioredoxin